MQSAKVQRATKSATTDDSDSSGFVPYKFDFAEHGLSLSELMKRQSMILSRPVTIIAHHEELPATMIEVPSDDDDNLDITERPSTMIFTDR